MNVIRHDHVEEKINTNFVRSIEQGVTQTGCEGLIGKNRPAIFGAERDMPGCDRFLIGGCREPDPFTGWQLIRAHISDCKGEGYVGEGLVPSRAVSAIQVWSGGGVAMAETVDLGAIATGGHAAPATAPAG
jgi:hypothetical protein